MLHRIALAVVSKWYQEQVNRASSVPLQTTSPTRCVQAFRVLCNADGLSGIMRGMNAYSEELRKKIVEAMERGMPKIEPARTFGVGIPSVKRYVAAAREGRSLAPKKRPGSKPKLDEGARKLLEADLEEPPAATLPQRREFLRLVRGMEVSDFTVSRVLKRLGWTRKKDGWVPPNATSS